MSTHRYPGGVISATPPTASFTGATGVWTLEEAMRNIQASNWPNGSGIDPYFKYVSVLMTGDGTNGAQNNTFLDGSTNNYTITRNGNTTQGSVTPYFYAGCWSDYYASTSSGWQTGASTITPILGSAFNSTATFTVEAWIYPLSRHSGGGAVLGYVFGSMQIAGSVVDWSFGPDSNGNLVTFWYQGGNQICKGGSVIPLNTWTHVALSVSSGSIKMFVNGVLETTTGPTSITLSSQSVNYVSSGGYLYAGTTWQGFNGYISNLRVVKSTALYTATFTPSTTPLTAITNTTLLTCNSQSFVDKSTLANTITPTGSVAVSRFSSFSALTPYSDATYAGSGYFDGTGDYLSNTTANLTATGSFTLEYWIYNTSAVTGSPASFSIGNEATSRINFFITSTAIQYNVFSGANTTIGSYTFYPGTWYHIAIVRSGTTLTAYVNGTSAGSVTLSGTLGNATGVYINGTSAGANTGNPFYLSNLRYVNGTAVYTGNFTAPTTPVTAIANTQLLLNAANAGIENNTSISNFETVGSAQVSTGTVKYGTGSMYFTGTGSYLIAPNSPLWAFNTGDWTIEFWVYLTSTAAAQHLIDTRASGTSTAGVALSLSSSGLPVITTNNATLFTSSTAITTSTWTSVALVKSSGTITLYLNGTKPVTGSAASATSLTDQFLTIGTSIANRDATATNHMIGYMDDLRITNGYARYTSNYTPPGGPFPNF